MTRIMFSFSLSPLTTSYNMMIIAVTYAVGINQALSLGVEALVLQFTRLQHDGRLSTYQEVSNFRDRCDGSLIAVDRWVVVNTPAVNHCSSKRQTFAWQETAATRL